MRASQRSEINQVRRGVKYISFELGAVKAESANSRLVFGLFPLPIRFSSPILPSFFAVVRLYYKLAGSRLSLPQFLPLSSAHRRGTWNFLRRTH